MMTPRALLPEGSLPFLKELTSLEANCIYSINQRTRKGEIRVRIHCLTKGIGFMAGNTDESYLPQKHWNKVAIPRPSVKL